MGANAGDVFVTVWLNSVNLREKPKTDSAVVAVVEPGDPLELIGTPKDPEKIILRNHAFDEPWFHLRLWNGKEGWVYGGALAITRKIPSNQEEFGSRFPEFQLSNPTPFLSAATLDKGPLTAHLSFTDFGSWGKREPQGNRIILGKYSLIVDEGVDSVKRDYYLRCFWDGKTLTLISRSSDPVPEEARPMLGGLMSVLEVSVSTNTEYVLPWKTAPDPALTINKMGLQFEKTTNCPTVAQWVDVDSEGLLWMNGWRVYRPRPEGVCWEYSTEPGGVIDRQTQTIYDSSTKYRFAFREEWDQRDYIDLLSPTFELRQAVIPVNTNFEKSSTAPLLPGIWYIPKDPMSPLVKDYYLSVFRPFLQDYLDECRRTGFFNDGSGAVTEDLCSEKAVKKAQDLNSFEEFSKRRPLLFLRDSLGRWIRFHNTANFPPQL